jgi:CheY-like chemotaxis protein
MPKSRRFLLVDDSVIALKVNSRLLEHSFDGCHIETYIHAQDALEFFEENKDEADRLPDTLLLDIIMPVMNGFQFIEKLEMIFGPSLPFRLYLLSSTLDEDDFANAHESRHVVQILNKPLDASLLHMLSEL